MTYPPYMCCSCCSCCSCSQSAPYGLKTRVQEQHPLLRLLLFRSISGVPNSWKIRRATRATQGKNDLNRWKIRRATRATTATRATRATRATLFTPPLALLSPFRRALRVEGIPSPTEEDAGVDGRRGSTSAIAREG